MNPPALSPLQLHTLSQLAYLDVVPAMEENGVVTVGSMARYYLRHPLGRAYLAARFGDIPQEFELWKQFLSMDLIPFRDWIVTDILNDNAPRQSGFYGSSFISPGGQRVIAFRGSELLGNPLYRNDYMADVSLAYVVPTPQQAMVDEYWRRFPIGRNEQIYLTGHSLGGNLALHGAIAAPAHLQNRIVSTYAFNAPGFSDEYIEQYKDAIEAVRPRIFLVQNELDIVSSLLHNVKAPLVVESLYIPSEEENPTIGQIMYPHSNFMFKISESGQFVPAVSDKKCRFCRLSHTLTSLLLLLPRTLRKGIAETVLDALYAVPDPKKARRYMLEAATKYVAHQDLFTKATHAGLGAMIYAAQLMEQDATSGQLYHDILEKEEVSPFPALSRALLLLVEAVEFTHKKPIEVSLRGTQLV
ncbi:Mbeg1-like protein [Oscillospiraceae bacterium MB08-C2-2]|nr:Mbeg1-like protein [Oscillospiraceae bacterium MB08-C2-2]